MPEGAVYVGRPTKWGNPYPLKRRAHIPEYPRRLAVDEYRRDLVAGRLPISVASIREELRGKVLVCWCPLGATCHADVLLEIANA